MIVFGSEYRTTPGHVDPQASARRLLDGGPIALGFAPAGFHDNNGYAVRTVAAVGEDGDPSALETAEAIAARFGAAGRAAGDRRSRPDPRRLEARHSRRAGDDQRRRRVPDRALPLPRDRPPPRRRGSVLAMPAEASRLRRRVGRRDRRVLVLLATLAVAGTAAGIALPGGEQPPETGCITYAEAGVLGGGTWRLCGKAAVERCAAAGKRLAEQCARLERTGRD